MPANRMAAATRPGKLAGSPDPAAAYREFGGSPKACRVRSHFSDACQPPGLRLAQA